jgi:hypothetical protein
VEQRGSGIGKIEEGLFSRKDEKSEGEIATGLKPLAMTRHYVAVEEVKEVFSNEDRHASRGSTRDDLYFKSQINYYGKS